MFFRVKVAILFTTLNAPNFRAHSRCPQSETAGALRQVSTLPHRESNGNFLLIMRRQSIMWSRAACVLDDMDYRYLSTIVLFSILAQKSSICNEKFRNFFKNFSEKISPYFSLYAIIKQMKAGETLPGLPGVSKCLDAQQRDLTEGTEKRPGFPQIPSLRTAMKMLY